MVGRKQEVQEADFETVRSAILGEQAPPVNQQIEPSWKQKYSQANANVPKEFEQPNLDMPNQLDIKQPYSQSFSREQPQQIEQNRGFDRRDMYELFDRIAVIEAQLTAIRSQSETINERLKMLDIKLSRRY